MADLQLTDQVAANGQYTFVFTSDGWWKKSASDCVYKITLAGLPISDINASYIGGLFGAFSDVLRVTFTWQQAGWSVQQVAQNLEGALNSGPGNYTFVSGTGGWPTSSVLDKIRTIFDETTGTPTGGTDSTYKGTSPGFTGGDLVFYGFLAVLAIALIAGVGMFGRGLAERV